MGYLVKRYWLFSWNRHYPNGGMMDFVDEFDKKNDAIHYVEENYFGEAAKGEDCLGHTRQHIYDVQEQKIILVTAVLVEDMQVYEWVAPEVAENDSKYYY